MTGPRGAGKTALLRHFKRLAEAEVDVLWTTPNKLQDVDHLRSLTVPRPLWSRIQGRLSGIGIPRVAHFHMVRGTPGVNRATDLQEAAILERSRARPPALVIDEAHVSDLKIGQGILNAAQCVRGNGGALLLVLAGTPDLIGRLNQLEAHFGSRCKQMGMGLLSSRK